MDTVHLLIVDDDARMRGLLAAFLRRNGFLVSQAQDAAHARRLLEGLSFDLLVMDVMMPGEDGISLCADLRQRLTVPMILLTARSETGDRIAGLEAGADDYLSKPFDPKELLLRINAILRRLPEAAPMAPTRRDIMLGALRYDLAEGLLWEGQSAVRLTATEAQLMEIFAANLGQPLSRSALVEKLGRHQDQAQERAVDVQITRLRRKLEQDPKEPRFLQTVRGVGYILLGE